MDGNRTGAARVCHDGTATNVVVSLNVGGTLFPFPSLIFSLSTRSLMILRVGSVSRISVATVTVRWMCWRRILHIPHRMMILPYRLPRARNRFIGAG